MRYRFRKGNTELEIERTEPLTEKTQAVLEDLVSEFADLLVGENGGEDEAGSQVRERKSGRGGPRSPHVSKGIDRLMAEGWLVQKSTRDIVEKLKELGVLMANEENVKAAMVRKVRARRLVRQKNNGDWTWSIPVVAM